MSLDPQLMRRFFLAIAAILSKREQDTIAAHINPGQEEPPGGGAIDGAEAFLVAQQFDLGMKDQAEAEARLHFASTECRIISEDSEDSAMAKARVFLFDTHLCIEQLGFMIFTQRRRIELADVLGVHGELAPENVFMVNGLQWRQMSVQMKGTSLDLAFESDDCLIFAQTIERKRLRHSVAADAAPANPKMRRNRVSTVIGSDAVASSYKFAKIREDGDGAADADGIREGTPGQGAKPNQPKSEAKSENALLRLTQLEPQEWSFVLGGARLRQYEQGEPIVLAGSRVDGLMQVASGTLRLEITMPGRPQALVLGRLHEGQILGEATFLLGTAATASIVCETEEASLIRLPEAYLHSLFEKRPELAGKFYCFLATRAAEQLRTATGVDEVEMIMHDSSTAPKTMAALTANEAFFAIFDGFVKSEASLAPDYAQLLNLCHAIFALQVEANPAAVHATLRTIYEQYIGPAGAVQTRRLFTQTREALLSELEAPAAPHVQRHLYDSALATCLEVLEAGCLRGFLRSPQYDYIHDLRRKESMPLSLAYFQVQRIHSIHTFHTHTPCMYSIHILHTCMCIYSLAHLQVQRKLGEGGFGQVVEVCKRDSRTPYAMKVISKAKVSEIFGDGLWEVIVMMEREILGRLHHPLLINLAYAFQNAEYLMLVMDLCEGGDLEPFGAKGELKLNEAQLRFVGLEVLAVLHHLFCERILYRDLKPENLLLDVDGHVRLVDFGTAKLNQAADATAPPTSSEECGSGPYMAPEIKEESDDGVGRQYSCACDYFSFGVVLYELAEKAYPFGDYPEYTDVTDEFVQPELLGDDGIPRPRTSPLANRPTSAHAPNRPPSAHARAPLTYAPPPHARSPGEEIPHLYDLLTALLDWDPVSRLGGTEAGIQQLKSNPYWGDADWELIGARKLPSPLAAFVEEKQLARQEERVTMASSFRRSRSGSPAGSPETLPAETSEIHLTRMSMSRLSTASPQQAGKTSAGELLRAMEAAEKRQKQIEEAEAAQVAGAPISAAQEKLLLLEAEMSVEGWEFVSQHALAMEHVGSYAVRRRSQELDV